MKETVSGIYIIKNKVNGKIYVGSSVNIFKRWETHKRELKYNTHKNEYLQRAFNKYGINNFNFFILEALKDRNLLVKREQHYLDFYRAYDRECGYNFTSIAGVNFVDKKVGKKIGNSLRGKIIPQEVRNKIAFTLKSKPKKCKFVDIFCDFCHTEFKLELRKYNQKKRNNKLGIFCSIHCSTKYQQYVRRGFKDKPEHGTLSRYGYWQCRCNLCKKTKHLDYIKKRYKLLKEN